MAKYKGDLIKHTAETLGCEREVAQDAVDAVLRGIRDLTADGDMLILKGFGTFGLRYRKASVTTNPRTGEPMRIGATKRLGFRAAKNS